MRITLYYIAVVQVSFVLLNGGCPLFTTAGSVLMLTVIVSSCYDYVFFFFFNNISVLIFLSFVIISGVPRAGFMRARSADSQSVVWADCR